MASKDKNTIKAGSIASRKQKQTNDTSVNSLTLRVKSSSNQMFLIWI